MPKKVIPKAVSPKDQELVRLPPPAQQAATTPSKPPSSSSSSHATDQGTKASGKVVEGKAKANNEVQGQKGKEVISQEPQKSQTSHAADQGSKASGRVEEGKDNANGVKGQKGKEVISQEPLKSSQVQDGENEKKVDASIPPKAKVNEVKDQKGKEVISQESQRSQIQGDASIPPKVTSGDSMTQKGEEGVEKKYGMKLDKKIQTEEIEGPLLGNGGKQRVEERKSGLKVDKKIQTDEVEGPILEKGEKQRVEKKETKEDIMRTSEKAQEVIPLIKPTSGVEKLAGSNIENGKTSGTEKKETKEVILAKPSTSRVEQAGKASIIAGVNAEQKGQDGKDEKLVVSVSQDGKNREAEKKETREVIGKTTSEAGKGKPPPDVIDLLAEKESMKEERKESTKRKRNDMYGNFEGVSEGLKDIINYPKGKRMKEIAASASQAVTTMAKRFSEKEDNKQMIIYMGAAAVLATAVIGVCASYTFRSISRP